MATSKKEQSVDKILSINSLLSIDSLEDQLKMAAKEVFRLFNAFTEAGFTAVQAMQLVSNIISGVLVPPKK